MNEKQSINDWFAAEVKDRMDEMGIRPYHLVTLCQIKENELDSCLNGTKLPSLFSLILLADCLECTVNDLLGYDEIEETEVYEQYTASSMYFAPSQYATCLSDRIRRYLKNRFMTLSDLIKRAELNEGSVRRWFAKTHPHLPSTANFLKICDALNCTPSELLGY